MLRILLIRTGLMAALFTTSAFTLQESGGVNLPTGWIAFIFIVVIIGLVAILLILQSRKTPEAMARYHLDHAEHTPSEETTPAAGKAAGPETAIPDPQADEITEPELSSAEAEGVIETRSGQDDLTRIEGVGPKIAQLLNQAGISTYQQLANSDPTYLKGILAEAGARFSLADPFTWPEQASYLAAGDEEKFKSLLENLHGGSHR
jgi:predicted flap endonuclease-1-like 5' DNA nuclease